MKLEDTLMGQKVFDENQKMRMNLVQAHAILTEHKPENKSVFQAYISMIVLPCGSVSESGLSALQNESKKRLRYGKSVKWRKMLWRDVTWHDVVLWCLLPELTDGFGYQPKRDELDIMMAVYKTCRSCDERMFKLILGILHLPLPSK
jgi:hypothetical protein